MNINEVLRKAQRMQSKLEQVRQEAAQRTAEGTAGGGMVTVVANGRNELISVKIDKQVVDPDEIEMLQDLVVAAANQALERVREQEQAEVSKITGGLPIPGLF